MTLPWQVQAGVAGALVVAGCLLTWFVTDRGWQARWNEREAQYSAALAAQKAQALADQQESDRRLQEASNAYQVERETTAAALAAARGDRRVIRVRAACPATGGLPAAGSAGRPDARPAGAELSRGDEADPGTVLDPQPLYELAAECDGLRAQVVGLQAVIRGFVR